MALEGETTPEVQEDCHTENPQWVTSSTQWLAESITRVVTSEMSTESQLPFEGLGSPNFIPLTFKETQPALITETQLQQAQHQQQLSQLSQPAQAMDLNIVTTR